MKVAPNQPAVSPGQLGAAFHNRTRRYRPQPSGLGRVRRWHEVAREFADGGHVDFDHGRAVDLQGLGHGGAELVALDRKSVV